MSRLCLRFMPRSSTARHVMTAAVLLLAACGSAPPSPPEAIRQEITELRAAIGQTLGDPVREREAVAAADRLRDAALAFNARVTRFRTELRAMNARPDTQEAALRDLFSRFDADRNRLRSDILDAHFALVQASTAEDWVYLSKAEHKVLQAALRTE